MASQYSTATAATCADRGNGPRAAGQQGGRNAAANGLHADEHAVKPHDIRRNRTSSAASGAGAGRVRSNQGGNRGFFQNPPPPDGPRPSQAAAEPLPPAGARALDNDTIAAAADPCPARWSDTDGPPAAVTRCGPPPRRLYYSTAKEDAAVRTTAHIPSGDKSERGSGSGLAIVSKSNHAGPRTFASANSRRSSPGSGASTPLRGVLDRSPPARPTSVQLNHTAADLPTLAGIGCHPVPVSPRFIRARPGPLSPRKWPPVSPLLTYISLAMTVVASKRLLRAAHS